MAETADSPSGAFETRKDAGDGGPGVFRLWMTALDLAGETEKDWRKSGLNAIRRYRDEQNEHRSVRFNILYSSIQTQGPSVYNSTPKPDVRRRFNDKDVPGKIAAQVFERSLTHCIDEYDFDCTMEAATHDALLVGRGVAFVVYDPVMDGDDVAYEKTRVEHVQWDDFRRGPAKRWEDVPWVAVRYRITRDEAIALNPDKGRTVNLDHVENGADKEKDGKDVPDVFKRLTVWKIWDKSRRQVVFIAPSFKEGPFAVEQDQLNLSGFFPFPRPIYDVVDSSSLVPLVPFDMYRDQAEELDRVTRRIHALINVLRWRGIRPSNIPEFDRLKDIDDGELVPSESFQSLLMTQGANPDSAVWLMPIERLITVIRELVVQREAIKQVVFEISGLADIMRGETDPDETLGAQQIKAQWGSLRMQKRQREVQRFARDLLRIKAEIIGEQYSPETLSMITGIRLPTPEDKQRAQVAVQQAQMTQQPAPDEVQDVLNTPTWDEVKQIMASDALRSFRVDVETDSTIQADQTRTQQNMAQFVEGLGAFAQSVGPMIEGGAMPMDVATDLLTAFARNFKLGRQAEDALERLGEQAREPQQERPDPEMAKVQAEQERAQREQALKEQQAEQEMAMERERMQAEIAMKQQQAQIDTQLKAQQAEQEMQLKRDIAAVEAGIKQRSQTMAEEGELRQYEASQGTPITSLIDEAKSSMAEISRIVAQVEQMAQAALQAVEELRAEAAEPVELTPVRENGRIVGARRKQGSRETEVTIN